MDLLNTLPSYKTIFEPFNIYWFPQFRNLKVDFSRPYVDIDKKYPPLESYLHFVFRGKVFSLSPQYRLNPKEIYKRVFGKKILVKFTKANLLLPWISNNFKLRGLYLVIRYPCATIASQIKKILHIIGLFGLDFYNVPPLPDYKR